MPAGKRSMRAQLLLNAITSAQMAASKDDYLNAVTNMIAAANSADYKLPHAPFGMPDIIRGDTWKKWRAFYHRHFPTVHEHVNGVLKKLTQGGIEVGEAEDDGE